MDNFQRLLDVKLKDAIIESTDTKIIPIEYDVSKEIRDAIIEIRKMKNLSQKELAEITGISQANMSKIENGYYIPSISILKRIADGLDKRLSVEFVDIEEEM